MKRTLLILGIAIAAQFVNSADADVVLTFLQDGVFDGVAIDQNYGDNVDGPVDSNNHMYDIVIGAGFGLTPNVEVSYQAADPRLWTDGSGGYGDLEQVYYNETDFSDSLALTLTADPGYEVGLFSFDMAAFSTDAQVKSIMLTDGNGNTLWQQNDELISSLTRNSFDLGTSFVSSSLTLTVNLEELGGASDNIGIGNVRFGQQAVQNLRQ